ncbi:MAG: DNA polymerase/3'-5' exonuclease PolX [Acidimicrobiales bacterium]
MASSRDVLDLLDELAQLTTLKEQSPQSFKVRAYENAKQGLQADGRDVIQLSTTELTKIKGIGKSTAGKIREFIDTGQVDKLEQLRAEFPPSVVELSRIPGVGPKTLALMRAELGIEDLDALKEALDKKQLRELKGLGAKAEEKIGKAIERLGLSGKDRRRPIGDAMPLAERLVEELKSHEDVVDALYCGSLRRMSETIGDVDITVASNDGPAVMALVREQSSVHEVILSGDTKTSFLTRDGMQVDVRVVAPEQFGAATLYFTGSKAHNIAIRQRALDRGLLLNEYGLLRKPDDDAEDQTPTEVVAAETEESIYDALDMAFVLPVMRENTGEVEAAAADDLPDLVQVADIKGDLHYHTDRSGDGRSSVEEMIAQAAGRGYDYLAITDHGEDLAINGSTAEEMLEHREHIAEAAKAHPHMTILWGCELNIGAGGGLDYDDDFRALFDYTVASVHSHYDQSVKEQTARLVAAIADPTVNSIGHLTGRYIGRRPGIEIDVDVVLEALFQFDKALEVNGALQRLDAASDVVRKAVDRGVKLVINTDSHHVSELGRIEYGVKTAQRGWAPRELVVNTWPKERFLTWAGLG